MAKTKGKKPELLEQVDLGVEAHIAAFQELKLSGGAWTLKFTVDEVLSTSHQLYDVALTFDEKPDMDSIAAIKRDLEAGLFKDEPIAKKNAEKSIVNIEKEIEKKRELCEDITFIGAVTQLKYVSAGTELIMLIDDKVVEAFNRQKTRITKLYKVHIEPKI